MKNKSIKTFLLTLTVLLASCSGDSGKQEPDDKPNDSPEQSETKTGPRDKNDSYKVLFVGNSFTYFNDLNQPNGIFANIAKDAGYKNITVDTVYSGGYYLYRFLDTEDEKGRELADKLNSTKYDIVVIQEQSSNSIRNPAQFYESCRSFKQLIDKNGAEMYLYSTWGYLPGHAELPIYGQATETMTATADMEMKIRAAYTAIGEELNVPVIQAGAAMTKAHIDYPSINLYRDDYYHPVMAASYLVAWTMVGTIFRINPMFLEYNGSLASYMADSLRDVASYIVKNGAPVDPKYKTSSIGVVPVESSAEVLTQMPTSDIVSVVYRDSNVTGDGWKPLITNKSKTFSGIRGDKDKIASTAYNSIKLSDEKKADIADIGYGVSIIGIDHMDDTKSGSKYTDSEAGDFTSVGNLVNGHWGSSYMTGMFFDEYKYSINGEVKDDGEYTSLITLNFGKVTTFHAIGYFSGNLKGFPQAQDVFVSDDGVNWTKVPSACYDTFVTTLVSINPSSTPDPWNGNKASAFGGTSMNNASGKYIRIGVIRGGIIDGNDSGLEEINTRELAVFGY